MARDCPNLNQNEPRRQPPSDQPRSTAPAGRGRPPAARSNQQPGNVKKPQAGGWVFCLEVEEGNEDPHAVVSGMFSVNTLPTRVLFDASATHSFIDPATAKLLACVIEDMNVHLCVATPIVIQNQEFLANLVVLGIQGYNVILGMDWLTAYQATIDCK